MRRTEGLAAIPAPRRAGITRHAQRVAGAAALAAGLCALLLFAGADGLSLRQVAAAPRSAPLVSQGFGTISLLSPSSGNGPVGATLTVQGTGWTANQVAIGAASSANGCVTPNAGGGSGWVGTFGTVTTDSGGTIRYSFTWPASLTASAPYTLCAISAPGGHPDSTGGVSAPQTYTVRSSQPPTLALSSSSVQVDQPFTITGSNFFGASTINISINNVLNQTATPDGGGSFIVTVTPTANQAGNANILAQSPPEGNAPPVLTATAQITVLGAPTVTPDPSPSPSPSPSATSTVAGATGSSGGAPTGGGGSGGLVVVLIVAILLLLALIVGVIVFLVLRRRGGSGPAFPGGPGGPGSGGDWGGYSGPGRGTGPVPQYGQSASGNYGATGIYYPGGFSGPQAPYPGSQVGGVAQWGDAPPAGGVAAWDDPDSSAPGPDWQPRPMSNSRQRYDDPSYPTYDAPDDAPPGPYGPPPAGNFAPPPDPWASAPGGNSPRGGATQGYPPPPQPGRGATGYPPRPGQRPDDGWNDGGTAQDDDWNRRGDPRGPGGTNPANSGW